MVKNKKNKHDLWKRLRFKYRLSVMNENTLEEVWTIKASIFTGAVLLLVFAFLLITVTSVIIIATPIRYYLPGYMDAEIRENALRAAIRTDSLEKKIDYQEAYIRNMKDVFGGKRQIDSVKMIDTISVSSDDPALQKTESEKRFVKQYEEEEKYNLSVLPLDGSNPMDGLVFFKPAKGVVVNKFEPLKKQFGITVKIAGKETVLAALEGAVMFAGYDINTCYSVQLQNKNDFIYLYR